MTHIEKYFSCYAPFLPQEWYKVELNLEYFPVEDATGHTSEIFVENNNPIDSLDSLKIQNSWEAGENIFNFFRDHCKSGNKINKATIIIHKEGKIEINSTWDEEFFKSVYGISSDDIEGLVELWIETERLVALTGIPEEDARRLVSAKYGIDM